MTGPAGWAALGDDPGWRRLLAAARRSLERTGGKLDGSVSLAEPTDDERRVVIGSTGRHRPASSGRLTVRLSDLDDHLRSTAGGGLVEVLAAGAPLRDRPAEARRVSAARETMLSDARRSRYGGEPWFAEWLDGLARDGTLTRAARGAVPFADALRVLAALPAADEPMPVFADRILHDTKALTAGPLRGLVLRAVADWQRLPAPASREQERLVWESVGVVPDDLASQVLVLNVPADGGLVGRWLTEAAAEGVPLRVTLHQLRLAPLRLTCDEVFVCENPAVLRAAATTWAARCRPLLCAEGVPAAALHALLRGGRGAVIRWRNDFDWTGVRLTAAALHRYPAAVPWRMTADDYRAAAGSGPGLLGAPAETPWDPDLAVAMRSAGRSVMEERLLPRLLDDLAPVPSR
nr:TIGR02679 family protein [Micromonospora sp. DSM 115978]